MICRNETYDVFISYSRKDWRHAPNINSILRAKGLKSFFDWRNLSPVLPWVRALERAIGAAQGGDRADWATRARQYPTIRARPR